MADVVDVENPYRVRRARDASLWTCVGCTLASLAVIGATFYVARNVRYVDVRYAPGTLDPTLVLGPSSDAPVGVLRRVIRDMRGSCRSKPGPRPILGPDYRATTVNATDEVTERFAYRVGCWCRADGTCALLLDPSRVLVPESDVAATLWCRDEDGSGSSSMAQRNTPLVLGVGPASAPSELVFDDPHDVCGAAQLAEALA